MEPFARWQIAVQSLPAMLAILDAAHKWHNRHSEVTVSSVDAHHQCSRVSRALRQRLTSVQRSRIHGVSWSAFAPRATVVVETLERRQLIPTLRISIAERLGTVPLGSGCSTGRSLIAEEQNCAPKWCSLFEARPCSQCFQVFRVCIYWC